MRDLALHVTRAVDDADAAALAAIDAASFPHPTLDLAGELARSFARLWLAREGADDGPIVGFLLAWLVADEVHVLTVATAPDHRRRGVARALLDHLLVEARARRTTLLLLELRESNAAARALYEGFGFTAFSVRKGYYAEEGEDATEMRLALDAETGEIVPDPSAATER